MDEGVKEELRALRDRAYGPHADIHHDPAAVERLRELESADRGVTPEGAAIDVPLGCVLHEQQTPPAEEVSPQAGSESASPALRSPRLDYRSWSLHRIRWVWIGSIVFAVILGAALAVVGDGWLSRVGEVRQVGTLREVDDLVWPETLGTATEDARGFTEFHGLTVITTEQQWGGIGTDTCMLVMNTADVTLAAPSGGSLHWGCGTTGFPATVQFEVTTSMPEELIEQFPVGTALKFALRASPNEALGELEIDVLAHAD